uniref:Uncharacterized protein n=1 Tax=Parascaris equorum TaxID=6256 RepID=A0A914RE70_PAREQ
MPNNPVLQAFASHVFYHRRAVCSTGKLTLRSQREYGNQTTNYK